MSIEHISRVIESALPAPTSRGSSSCVVSVTDLMPWNDYSGGVWEAIAIADGVRLEVHSGVWARAVDSDGSPVGPSASSSDGSIKGAIIAALFANKPTGPIAEVCRIIGGNVTVYDDRHMYQFAEVKRDSLRVAVKVCGGKVSCVETRDRIETFDAPWSDTAEDALRRVFPGLTVPEVCDE